MHGNSHHRFRIIAPFYDFGLRLLCFPFGGEKRLRRSILGLLSPERGERLLEIGCGTGTVSLEAAGLVGAEGMVVGIDPVPEMLALARKKGKDWQQVTFAEGPGSPLPFPDGSFDSVIFFLVLHEMDHRDRIEALAEAMRVLKPGGRLLVGELAVPLSRGGRLAMRALLLVEEAEARDFLHRGLAGVIGEGTGDRLREERRTTLAGGMLQGVCYRKVS